MASNLRINNYNYYKQIESEFVRYECHRMYGIVDWFGRLAFLLWGRSLRPTSIHITFITPNKAFAMTCPDLTSKYAQYPIKFERWLSFDEMFEGKKAFLPSEQDEGFKEDYVYCKRGPKGKGYYHILTKVSNNNLYSRISSSSPGVCCFGDAKAIDAWDTTRVVVYARSRASRPDDEAAKEQCVDHHVGTKLNPVHGLKV